MPPLPRAPPPPTTPPPQLPGLLSLPVWTQLFLDPLSPPSPTPLRISFSKPTITASMRSPVVQPLQGGAAGAGAAAPSKQQGRGSGHGHRRSRGHGRSRGHSHRHPTVAMATTRVTAIRRLQALLTSVGHPAALAEGTELLMAQAAWSRANGAAAAALKTAAAGWVLVAEMPAVTLGDSRRAAAPVAIYRALAQQVVPGRVLALKVAGSTAARVPAWGTSSTSLQVASCPWPVSPALLVTVCDATFRRFTAAGEAAASMERRSANFRKLTTAVENCAAVRTKGLAPVEVCPQCTSEMKPNGEKSLRAIDEGQICFYLCVNPRCKFVLTRD